MFLLFVVVVVVRLSFIHEASCLHFLLLLQFPSTLRLLSSVQLIIVDDFGLLMTLPEPEALPVSLFAGGGSHQQNPAGVPEEEKCELCGFSLCHFTARVSRDQPLVAHQGTAILLTSP